GLHDDLIQFLDSLLGLLLPGQNLLTLVPELLEMHLGLRLAGLGRGLGSFGCAVHGVLLGLGLRMHVRVLASSRGRIAGTPGGSCPSCPVRTGADVSWLACHTYPGPCSRRRV